MLLFAARRHGHMHIQLQNTIDLAHEDRSVIRWCVLLPIDRRYNSGLPLRGQPWANSLRAHLRTGANWHRAPAPSSMWERLSPKAIEVGQHSPRRSCSPEAQRQWIWIVTNPRLLQRCTRHPTKKSHPSPAPWPTHPPATWEHEPRPDQTRRWRGYGTWLPPPRGTCLFPPPSGQQG